MKKLTGFITTLFITAVSYAQVPAQDTVQVPVMNGNNRPMAIDTAPVRLRTDTARTQWNNNNNQNNQWNKDSAGKRADQGNSMNQWKDTVAQNAKEWNNGTQATNPNQGLSDSAKTAQERITAESGNASEVPAAKQRSSWDSSSAGKTVNSDRAKKPGAAATAKKTVTDRVMMKEGEMVIVKNGKETKMTKAVTLDNGSTVSTDGTIKLPDGNTMKLKDGEHIALGTTPKKATKAPAKKSS